jgi:hypothetical protein
MDRGGVGDKRGSKEMDGCPLTVLITQGMGGMGIHCSGY